MSLCSPSPTYLRRDRGEPSYGVDILLYGSVGGWGGSCSVVEMVVMEDPLQW